MKHLKIALKRSILPSLIMLGLSAPTQAQSNVTMYGNLDVALVKQSNASAELGRGYFNWLGFKGREEIGSGLAATFNLQTRFDPGSGALERSKTFWQGESTVGLSSSTLGSLRLGRALTPMWNGLWSFEPWGNGGFTGSLASYQTGSYSSDGVNDVAQEYAGFARIRDAVFYDSPSMAGFQFAVAGQVEKHASAKDRNLGFAINYAAGNMLGKASYERNENSDTIYFIGGAYHFGPASLLGSYARTDVAGLKRENVYMVAGTYLVGADTIKAGYGRNQASHDHKFSVGYSHPLSKRTNVYADVWREKTAKNVNGYAVGMNHTF